MKSNRGGRNYSRPPHLIPFSYVDVRGVVWGHHIEDVWARGYTPALPAWLISERNGEREPSREEHRVYRREGAGREEEVGERSPAPAPCEHSKCSFHLQQELRQHQTDFQHTGWRLGGIDTKDQTASSRPSFRLHEPSAPAAAQHCSTPPPSLLEI